MSQAVAYLQKLDGEHLGENFCVLTIVGQLPIFDAWGWHKYAAKICLQFEQYKLRRGNLITFSYEIKYFLKHIEITFLVLVKVEKMSSLKTLTKSMGCLNFGEL